jgi:DNA-binding beta-propeller fold protein YncE
MVRVGSCDTLPRTIHAEISPMSLPARSGSGPSLAAVLLLCAACGALPAHERAESADAATWELYVPNQDDATISVVDTDSRRVVRTIDLTEWGFGPNAKPHHVVSEPDGSYWYVSLIGGNRVLKFDSADRLVGSAELEVPGMMAIDPAGDRLFVGRSMSAVNPPRRIGIVRRTDMTVDEVDVFLPRPHALAVTPDGGRLFVGSLGVNQFAVMEPDGDDPELVDVAGPHHTLVQFAVSPDGRWLVSTAEMTAQLLVFDLAERVPVSAAEVEVGQRPWHPVFTPDGRWVFFGNKGSNTVSVVDSGSWTEVAVLESEGLDLPHGSAVTPDGRWVFISSNGSEGARGTVAVIDTSGLEVVAVIPVGRNAGGIGLRRTR